MRTTRARIRRYLLITATVLLGGVSTAALAQGDPDHYAIAEDSWTVPPGDYILVPGYPPCEGPDPTSDFTRTAIKIAAAASAGNAISYGSIFKEVWRVVGGQTAGTAAEILDRIFGSNRYATCVHLAVVIPASAHILHMNFFATEVGGDFHSDPHAGCGKGRFVMSDPDQHFDCFIGWSAFDRPIIVTQGQYTVVGVVFRNWSHNRSRVPTMDVLWY